MSLAVSWLLFPLVLGLLSLGWGLLLEQVAGARLPRALLPPVGFAGIVVAGVLTTSNDTTARLTVPVVVALAVTGLALSLPWNLRRVDRWALASGAAVYAAFGAPVYLSGKATFAGYISLDDTSTWLGFTDRLLTHGRTVSGLQPSTYQAALDWYWNQNGYPVGAYPPLGIGHVLTGTDSAWLVQPYISFSAGLLALGLYALLTSLIRAPALRALAAFVAAQPALLYAYALWGGIKEVPTAALVVAVAALTPCAVRERAGARALIPLAVACAALVAILNFGASVWLLPLLVPALVAGLRVRGRLFAKPAASFLALVLVLSVPALLSASSFANITSKLLTKETELGNLIHPLSKLQLFGIWPVGDFRVRPGGMGPVYVLIAVMVAAGAAGLFWAVRRRSWEVPLYVGGTVVGCIVAVSVGSPWLDAKALAIASPALVVAGMSGAAWLFAGGRRVEAAVVAAAIVGGVLWSNALAYHDVWLAPRSQLAELETIGKRFAGGGPTLINEYQPYGARHFLRSMDPEAPSELRRRLVLLRDGRELEKGTYADIDRFQLDAVLVYRTLALPATPSESRPPSTFRRVWSGRFYDVWQQQASGAPRILEHLPLGSGDQAGAVPSCADVVRLAAVARRSGGRLAAVPRLLAEVVRLSQASYPAGWQSYSGSPDVVYPTSAGTLTARVRIARAGRYGLWLGGSFRGSLDVSVDGRHLFGGRDQLNHDGIDTPLGAVELSAGSHQVALRRGSAGLRPGSGGRPFPLGPLVLGRETAEPPVTYVAPADARSLCSQSLDWVEALAT